MSTKPKPTWAGTHYQAGTFANATDLANLLNSLATALRAVEDPSIGQDRDECARNLVQSINTVCAVVQSVEWMQDRWLPQIGSAPNIRSTVTRT